MQLNGKLFIFGFGVLVSQAGHAHGPLPLPLIDVPVPPVSGLVDGPDPIVVDKQKAIALGKALFWDQAIGSDGMACGSCHFHAGADVRTINQLSPSGKSQLETANTFEALPSSPSSGGANYTLKSSDFPTFQYADPLDQASGITFSTDDAVASSGTFTGNFTGASRFSGDEDQCERSADPVFNVGGHGTRRVEPRNAPTIINAIFNYRNFWDGRANNIFNGVNGFGDRDPDAGVWVKSGRRSVAKQKLHLENSSLASLALVPPLSDFEMGCRQRTWSDIGRKMLLRQPLQNQKVHHEDSVLGPYSLSTSDEQKPGLNTTYRTLIQQAFNSKYWAYSGTGPFGAPEGQTPYNQMEANFSMFFGLAIQLYEATLISDQAPIDLSPRDPISMHPTWQGMGKSAEEIQLLKDGFNFFINNHCNLCHSGPALTSAAISTNDILVTPTSPTSYYGPGSFRIPYGPNALGPASAGAAIGITGHGNVVDRARTAGGSRLQDMGFATTGVNDPLADPGINANDDYSNPLSFADQYVQYLLGNNENVKDQGVTTTRSCDFINPIAFNIPAPSQYTFTSLDQLIIDGSREGELRDQNCLDPNKIYIPSVAAANDAFVNQPAKLAVATNGSFKIPGLRNIELTGPYMHNGSMATLDQVVEFYSRHGNFNNPNKSELVDNISLSISAYARDAVVALLKSFTDDRVRYEKAPFDHPEVNVPNGHNVDQSNPLNPDLAADETLNVPAVGANGRAEPLKPFEDFLEP
ncbi:cytochrome c peroxidase [Methylomonas sp. MgM2]